MQRAGINTLPLVMLLSGIAYGAPDERLAAITVEAGDFSRIATPICVELPATFNAWSPALLVEVKGEERLPVAFQVEPGKPRKIWWILDGETPAGSTRKYELVRGVPVGARIAKQNLPSESLSSRGVLLGLTPTTLDVKVKGALLFRYNHGHVVPPKGVPAAFIRSGYIQPMYSPSGILLTEDFPADHHHHKGVWMPWTGTQFKGRDLDFWNLGKKEGTVQFAGFEALESGQVYGRFKAKHEHIDLRVPNGGTTVLDETWDVRVWSAGGPTAGFWLWDITSTQTCVADSPLHLKAYRYGGLGWRGPKAWKGDGYEILTSEAKVRKDAHATTSRWCAHSGVSDGKRTTVIVMCHPENERFPEPMRTWDNGMVFFNYVPPQKKPMDLEPGKPHVFRYRFYIHEGGIDQKRAERAWLDFGKPPRARIELFE